jgi:hypothetical protein
MRPWSHALARVIARSAPSEIPDVEEETGSDGRILSALKLLVNSN